ncbi:unnamed protein product [Arctia plantaginis]|uniref:Uncharacterized protein n=1 Tax=Arctia plantaginis TaxID=874455 RepID=A0A8S1BSX5_ARCPL|nr:unnamed protein product [Arctia plantaginis]CAB3262446.1 unnamed protein product [Arctia plantaginis]
MFGKLHLLLATTCILALIVQGYSECPIAKWGHTTSDISIIGPLVIDGNNREIDLKIPYPQLLGCDVVGVSAFTCDYGLDTKLHFVERFTVHVSRKHGFASTLYGIAYCSPVVPHPSHAANVPNNLQLGLKSIARPLVGYNH